MPPQQDTGARRSECKEPSGKDGGDAAGGRKLWGLTSGGWRKCTLVEVTKSGKYKVELLEGGTAVLPAGRVRSRGAKHQQQPAGVAKSSGGKATTKRSRFPEGSGSAEGTASPVPPEAANPKRQRIWGFKDGSWHKCWQVAAKKSGKLKVEWESDGTTKLLPPDYVQPRGKKKNSK